MPIYDQSYRHWKGRLRGRAFRWWVIAARGIGFAFRKKAALILIIMAMSLFLFRMVWVAATLGYVQKYFLGSVNIGHIADPSWPAFFAAFLDQQTIFIVLLTIFAGASLIANDLRGNAIAFYLARPITRGDYVFGKLAVIVLFVFAVTLAPGLVLFGVKAFLSLDATFLKSFYWMFFSIVAYSVLAAGFFGFFILMFSATTRTGRDAGLKFAGTFYVSDIVASIVHKITGKPIVMALSLPKDLDNVLHRLFGIEPKHPVPLVLAATLPVLVAALSAWIVFRRVRKAEEIR